MVDTGMLIKLNQEIRANSYLARSDPSDICPSKTVTFICPETRSTPARTTTAGTCRMRETLERPVQRLHAWPDHAHRTVLDGSAGSPIAHIGIETTDSPYVAVSMRTMTRKGKAVSDVLGTDGEFVPCMHTR